MLTEKRSFSGRVVAVTGARTDLGALLLRQLEADDRYERVLAIDIKEPSEALVRGEFHRVDLCSPNAELELMSLLNEASVDTLVHAAFLSRPTRALGWAHELEDVGTMKVLGAARRAKVERLVMTSTTLVYGANANNPVQILESAPLSVTGKSDFIAEKIRAEEQLIKLGKDEPTIAASVLRFAPIVGPGVRNFVGDLLSKPIVVRMLGFDPLIQLTGESDAAAALKRAVDVGARGPINVASRGPLPLSTILALLGRVPLSLPSRLLKPLSKIMWTAQLSTAPPQMSDYLRYMCVADTTRAEALLDFRPRSSVRELVRALEVPPNPQLNVELTGALH